MRIVIDATAEELAKAFSTALKDMAISLNKFNELAEDAEVLNEMESEVIYE